MRPPPTLRALLVRVAIAAVLPAALVMTALAAWPYLQERDRAKEGLVITARLLGASLDARLLRLERQLERIAQSIPLDDPASFHETALGLRDAEQIDALILVRPDGVHALNTRFPPGAPLPQSSPAMLTGAIRRGIPVINDLYMAPVVEHPTVGVGMPVVDAGQIRYALNGAIEATRIRDVLLQQALPPGWAASVIDRNGYVIAHTRDHDLHVGARSPALVGEGEGKGEGEGENGLLTASALSPATGWTVQVEVPQEQLLAPMQRRLAGVAIALLLLIGVILLAVRHLHATLLGAAAGLAHFVRQTRQGEDVDPPSLGIREVDRFAHAFKALDHNFLRTEVALASTQRRLTGIVETAMDAIITIDANRNIAMFNRAAEQAFGLKAGEAIGKPIEMLLPERHRRAHERAIQESGSTPAGSREMSGGWTVHARHASGAEFPVDASISTMTDEEGRRWMTVILRDVTQRVREREALVRSNLLLQQFAFVASHDLRAPLRTVMGRLDRLARAEPGLQPQSLHLLQSTRGTLEKMDQLTGNLLSYARLGEDRPMSAVDMNEAALDALDMLQAAVAETHAQIVLQPLPAVQGDRTQLVQLLQNLLGNAMKYSARQPLIELLAEATDTEWRFCVRDNGVGIEPCYLRQIFEPFKRLHTPAESIGTGIGLAICHRVVQWHGGRIWATSQPGEGSKFFFTLPIADRTSSDSP